ncbi:hypothetical protein B0G77_6827 [Paraburkholderia sp. BL10I2N1]|nr:hypothetical protein B0G77_6827 [Paraburkholderia sp. BL10I2N1]
MANEMRSALLLALVFRAALFSSEVRSVPAFATPISTLWGILRRCMSLLPTA